MMDAPSRVDETQLRGLGIRLRTSEGGDGAGG
jgi:hypothetical protein